MTIDFLTSYETLDLKWEASPVVVWQVPFPIICFRIADQK